MASVDFQMKVPQNAIWDTKCYLQVFKDVPVNVLNLEWYAICNVPEVSVKCKNNSRVGLRQAPENAPQTIWESLIFWEYVILGDTPTPHLIIDESLI